MNNKFRTKNVFFGEMERFQSFLRGLSRSVLLASAAWGGVIKAGRKIAIYRRAIAWRGSHYETV